MGLEIERFAVELARRAGERILAERSSLTVSAKGSRDLVTSADLASEQLIISGIQAQFPGVKS